METKLIAFTSMKGGVGKSTHVAALAAGLLDLGKTVRVIETDEQGTAAAWADEAAEAHENLHSVYLDLGDKNFHQANEAIIEASDGPEYVLLDTAGSANAATTAAVYTADLVLSPFMLTQPDTEGLLRTLALYNGVFERLGENQPGTFYGLFVADIAFMSNSDKERLKQLSDKMPIYRGLSRNPNIKKWMETCRTPKQLRSGIPRAEGSAPITDTGIEKADGFIQTLTTTVEGFFDA